MCDVGGRGVPYRADILSAHAFDLNLIRVQDL